MTCTEARPLLAAFGDDELSATDAIAVAAHLTGCAVCSALVADHAALRAAVREAFPRLRAPDTLRARVRSDLANSRVGAAQHRVTRAGVRVAVALVLMLGGSAGTLVVERVMSHRSMAADAMVARQVDALMARRSIEVVSTEHHTVKPWFAGRLEFSPPVPALDSAGATLEGARVDTVGGVRAAVLQYRERLHVIGVFVTYVPGARDRAPGIADARGYHVVQWARGQMNYAAVSDLDATELLQFVEAFRRAQ